MTNRGKVVPLSRWCNIRGRGTLQPLHLTTYRFGPSLTAALARRTSRPLSALQLVLTLCPAFLAPDRPVLLAVAVSAHASTTVPCGKRAHCPTGFRHRCLLWWKTSDGTEGNSYNPPFAIVLQLMLMLPSHKSGWFGAPSLHSLTKRPGPQHLVADAERIPSPRLDLQVDPPHVELVAVW